MFIVAAPKINLFIHVYSSRGGVGSSFNRHYVTLVSPREAPTAHIPDFFWKIRIYYYNPATGRTTTYYPDQLGKWAGLSGSSSSIII